MPIPPSNPERDIASDVGKFAYDPLGFITYAYPWGKDELKGHDGPMPWAREMFAYIKERLEHGVVHGHQPIQIAITSGHGITKSATAAQIIEWGLATCADCRIVVTANTAAQLATKTWPELSKWHRLSITKDWFEYTATALSSTEKGREGNWCADALPWTVNRSEAFAGLHNKGKRIIVIFDEASAIDDKIWEVTEGALTDEDTEIIWLALGNPTRNTGRFHACFHGQSHLWWHRQVDSRTVPISNKVQIQKWAEFHGEDSDFFKMRVRGEFPSTSDRQFISTDIVEAARRRVMLQRDVDFAATILGLDPAWTGGDETSLFKRQGNFSKMLMTLAKNDDDFQTAGYVYKHEQQEKADAVFIDFGYGTGIKSGGKALGRDEWQLIPFGGESPDPAYLNKRAYMWGMMKKWLIEGGSIPDDPVLAEELCAPEYYVVPTGKNAGKIYIESKDDMKARGLKSPNRADALALTFAYPVTKKADLPRVGNGPEMCVMECDPLA